jgi:hypothetical protein
LWRLSWFLLTTDAGMENQISIWGKGKHSVHDRKRGRDSLITGLSRNLAVWLCAGSAIRTEAVPKMGLDQPVSLSQKEIQRLKP